MIAYSRWQLVLLLALVVAGGAGVAIGEWRRARPEVAAMLEAFDRAADDDRVVLSARGPSSVRSAPPPAPRRPVETAAAREPLDLNHATAEELARLPGIGPVLAARIVTARETRGAFESVDDLQRVAGVGAAKLAAVRDRLIVTR